MEIAGAPATAKPDFSENYRWHLAVAVSLFINAAAFGLTSYMAKKELPPEEVYMPVELMEVTSATEPPPRVMAPVKPITPPPPLEKKSETPPQPEPVVKETAPPDPEPEPAPVEKEIPPPPPPVAQTEPKPVTQVAPPPPAPVAQAEPTQEYRQVNQLTKKPSFRMRVEPAYPESLRSSGMEGKVVVEVFLSAAGAVDNTRIVASAGPMFDAAVLRAVKASRFEPGHVNGQPVPVRVQIPFAFRLR